MLLGAALLGALPGAAQQDRWQITLRDGAVLWELQLVRLDGDTVVFQHGDSTLRLHLLQVDEVRLVQASVRQITPEAGRYEGVLNGANDEVYRLTLLDLAERRQAVRQILRDHPPQGPRAP